MILFLFFCSGATALVYEVVWSKYLSLMLGSTVQAQTVVLAVCMGGLALGNRLIGRRADLAGAPVRIVAHGPGHCRAGPDPDGRFSGARIRGPSGLLHGRQRPTHHAL